ncbi:SRPBCC family protein [Cellulomonas sp. Leaf334]|uniref:SRPBCC family protein n=1 Tax=Cellulomonas sp. Leaf334 TaxID=1736339 RepID=UPI00070018F8|nr:SRPBCC family protein [Cellulomonas sp. Leaf334]KQR12149.1 polyketide cyclase [Cellulomonas sp. Leaf334]
MTPSATGRRETRDGHDSVVFERVFRAPLESVWAAVTESDRLERWVGTWTGDPTTGSVLFRMNAEGDDAKPETFTIHECDPPHRVSLTSQVVGEQNVWHFLLELTEDAGTTTLTFSQSVPDAETATGVGPGWDYYLDRLVAAETGGDVAALDFDDYYPALSDHYRAVFA